MKSKFGALFEQYFRIKDKKKHFGFKQCTQEVTQEKKKTSDCKSENILQQLKL